ncbi:MAG: hypothetical protein AAGG00_16455 [Cyanobacteria bacterium P01_H01_bin.150]
MSNYEKQILDFIHIIEHQSDIFSHSDWLELHELNKELSDDDEEIYQEINSWLQSESHSHVLQAYQEQSKEGDDSDSIDFGITLGAARSKSSTSPSTKELLDNAIQRNSPLSDSPPYNQES